MFDIQQLKKKPALHLKVLGIWAYISTEYSQNSCIDKEHIRQSLNISNITARKLFSYLAKMGVIENRPLRKDGRIAVFKTILLSSMNFNSTKRI